MVTRRSRYALLSALSWCVVGSGVACQALFGVDPAETDGTSGSEDGGSGGNVGAAGSSAGGEPTACACLSPPSGTGWDGPFQVGEYALGQGPTTCPGGASAQRLYVGYQPAACGTCSCGGVGGASCPTQVLCYPSTDCSGTPTDKSAMFDFSDSDSCMVWNGPSPYSCKVVQSPASGGSCAVQAGTAVEASWQGERVLCRAPPQDGGCSDGQICAAPNSAGKVCYTNAADVGCPPGWDAPYVGYTGLQGALSCDPCSCGAPGGMSCTSAQFSFYSVDFLVCFSQVPLGSGCANVSGLDGYTSLGLPAAMGGGCAAAGGAVLSQPVPTGYTTICCTTP